jgi:HPt (histidine-containing phosphotransfer) domain-containing protein
VTCPDPTPPTDDFDRAALERLVRFGGAALLDSMAAIFRDQAVQRAAAARDAVVRADASAARLALHSLKSSAAQLGAMRLSRLCSEGEALAAAGSLEPLAPIVAAIDDETTRALDWIDATRQELARHS